MTFTFHVHIHSDSGGNIAATLEALMKANEQVLAFLAQLNDYTNALAAAQTVQTAKITEIAADIDALLASSGELSSDVVDKLTAASAGLKATVDFETAQADTLTAIAAKNDVPLPPVSG